MIRILLLTLFIFLTSAVLKAEVIDKLVINGNKRVSSETIKVYGEIEINKNISEIEINRILNNLYSTNFFEDVKIKVNQNTLFINVNEYPVINQLILIGEPRKSFKQKILTLIQSKEKRTARIARTVSIQLNVVSGNTIDMINSLHNCT